MRTLRRKTASDSRRMALLGLFLLLSAPLAAVINPEIFRSHQRNAPEQLTLSIDSVRTVASASGEDGRTLLCLARITAVKASASGLQPGRQITLKLTLSERPKLSLRPGCGAPPILPPPVVGKRYDAYLSYRQGVYVPAAEWLSLVSVNS